MSSERVPKYDGHDDLDDPAYIGRADPGEQGTTNWLVGEDEQVSLQRLLKTQGRVAASLQNLLLKSDLPPKDFKEIATAAGSLVALANRTDGTLRTMETYRLFVEVVVEFIRRRSDALGDDLVAELLSVAKDMRAEIEVRQLMGR